MIKMLLRKFLHQFRRLIGTAQILIEQEKQKQQQQQQLNTLVNGLMYYLKGQEEIKRTIVYQRSMEIVSLLAPMDVDGEGYVRVGKENDGGYVMLNNIQKENVDAAYSFGISDDVSWDEEIASNGIDVFMYDHTISQLPKKNPKFHFFKNGVTGYFKGPNLKTLGELIFENGHSASKKLIMKMDVEGCEWDIFNEMSSEEICQFSQFVVELHDLSPYVSNKKFSSIVNALRKINITHQSIHIHANCAEGIPLWMGAFVLPPLIEVTFIRRADVSDKLIANSRQFPTEIDQPTIANWTDLYLGRFSTDGWFKNNIH